MKHHLILLCAILLMLPVCVNAQFVLHDFTGSAEIKRNGAEVTPKKGMDCERNDQITLADGATLTLLNKINNTIYNADGPLQSQTVTSIVALAMKRSKQHASNVIEGITISANSTSGPVFEQNGMVRRSQAVLDPEAYLVNIEPEALAIAIINAYKSASNPHILLEVESDVSNGLSFMARSIDESPVYFNVIKFRTGNDGVLDSADISELGQPVNAYVLQPQQELTREQPTPTAAGEVHLLVATPFGFDVDELLDILDELISSNADIPASDPDIKLGLFQLN